MTIYGIRGPNGFLGYFIPPRRPAEGGDPAPQQQAPSYTFNPLGFAKERQADRLARRLVNITGKDHSTVALDVPTPSRVAGRRQPMD